MGRSSVFSLEQIYRKQVVGTWSKIPEVFRYVNNVVSTVNPYGYARNGSNSGIDRIDFNNDTVTASAKGSMATGINETEYNSNFGNLNYGYITGGKGSGPAPQPSNWATTSISRIDYSNDATAASPKGPYSTPVYNHGGVGNNDYGYSIAGQDFGYPPPAIRYSTIVRMDYSNDTVSPPAKSNYPYEGSGSFGLSGTGNMDYGWIANGMNNSIVHRIDYANDTVSPPSRTYLDRFGANGRKCTGNAFYGYWQGGYTQTKFSRVDFSNDTATGVTKGSSFQGYKNGSVTSKDYAYLYGNFYPYSSLVERMDYSNDDIAAAPKGPLSVTNGGGKHAAGVSAQQFGLPTGPVPATRTEHSDVRGPAGTDFGYVGGGYSGPRLSTVDRIDYSSDTSTAAVKGSLSLARNTAASVSSVTHGYFAGGYDGSNRSTVDRVDYANDTPTAAVKGSLGYTNVGGCPVGDKNYGYIVGGRFNGSDSTHISRIDYSNDATTSSPKGNITQLNWYFQNGAGNQSYGYVAGGYVSAETYVERIDYSNDTAVALSRGPLAQPVRAGAAAGNANFGYFSGGWNHTNAWYTWVQRLDYSSDTSTASLKGNLTVARQGHGSAASTSHGYFVGGNTGPASAATSVVDRNDFSNDTVTASPKGPLSAAKYSVGGTSSRENALPTTGPGPVTVDKGADGYTISSPSPYGYFGGGYKYGQPTYSTIRRIDYSNDSTVVAKSTLPAAAQELAGVASQSHGYWAGGGPGSYNATTFIRRLDFADDTTAATSKGNLATATYMAAGVGTKDYGYIAGGIEPSAISIVQRIDYSSDTSTASPKGNMTIIRALWGGATGNTSYAYFTAGWSPGASPARQSSVDRLDYSNDTATASPKGPLTAGKYGVGSTGNASYGYVGGGNPGPMSHVDRIDYANDTATALAKGPLAAAMRYMSVTGSSSNGYWLEGHPGPISTICRIDYSNDTASPSPGNGPDQYYGAGLSAAANALPAPASFIPRIRWVDSASPAAASVAGPAFGYFTAGGHGPSGRESVADRIDYSNDTGTALRKGPISREVVAHGAIANISHGYTTGGNTTLPGEGAGTSNVDRLDFSNDTSTGVAKGPLTAIGNYTNAVGNNSYGYSSIGGNSVSSIDRIDYSNDTTMASIKGPLATSSWDRGVTGTQSYGYWSGGIGSQFNSKIERIDYSNDTATALQVGTITNPGSMYGMAAAGYSSYGYFVGGGSPSQSIVNRLDYSNDTAASVAKGNLSRTTMGFGGTGNGSFGYFGGSFSPGPNTIVDRIDYSNDTAIASVKGPLSSARSYSSGYSPRANALPQITAAAVAAPVQPPFPYPVQLYNPATSKQHGYWACGVNRDPMPSTIAFSSVDRLDFSNDTTAASPKGNASFATAALQSVANASYGYITGGYTDHPPAGRSSSINRLDYANDTAALTVTGITPSDTLNGTGIYLGWGVGNASYGYLGGNYPGSSRIFRLDYSNDTSAPLISGKSISFSYGSAAGNQDYGWIGGVGHPLPSGGSRVERLDYSNDTNNTVTRGPLSSVRYDGAASSNASYGWWGAGKNGSPAYSYVDRIDFGNDTATASPKGNLQYATSQNDGTGDTNYGYFGGGGPAFSARSYIQRIDYANDTATSSPKGPLSVPRKGPTAFSAAANAMP